MRCSEIESGGAAGGLVLLPIVPRRIQTSGRYVCGDGKARGRTLLRLPKSSSSRELEPMAEGGHTSLHRQETDHHELAVLRR